MRPPHSLSSYIGYEIFSVHMTRTYKQYSIEIPSSLCALHRRLRGERHTAASPISDLLLGESDVDVVNRNSIRVPHDGLSFDLAVRYRDFVHERAGENTVGEVWVS